MSGPSISHPEALHHCFMSVHVGITSALDLLSVMQEENQATQSRTSESLAEAMTLLLQRAGWANQCASNMASPGLLDTANIMDWLDPGHCVSTGVDPFEMSNIKAQS